MLTGHAFTLPHPQVNMALKSRLCLGKLSKVIRGMPINLPASEETQIIDSDEDQPGGFRINWSLIQAVSRVALYMPRKS